MKKILSILMVCALFASCSDSDKDPLDNGNGNNNGMIDEKILGKWKVEYSKTIKGARFLEDGTLEVPEGAITNVYEGDFDGKESTIPKCGLFDSKEITINIKKDNTIDVYTAGVIKPRSISYKIEDNVLKWVSTDPSYIFSANHKYYFDNKMLIIERKPQDKITEYSISKYSKITE